MRTRGRACSGAGILDPMGTPKTTPTSQALHPSKMNATKPAAAKATKPAAVKATKPAAAKAMKPAAAKATKPAGKIAAPPKLQLADGVPEVTGSQEHYERFLTDAKALDAAAVKPFRIDTSLAYHNVERGSAALLPFADHLKVELPAIDLDQVRALPELALAVSFAASQVDRGGGAPKDLKLSLRRLYALREPLLASAVALAAAGVVPKREVEKIQEGRGSIDAAQDCVDLPAFYNKHAAAIRGKTPVTAAQLTEAAKLGTDMLKVLRKSSAKRDLSPKGELKQAIDVRDRLATLLANRYEQVRRAGYWLWGDAFEKHVPAFQARVVTRRKVEKAAKAETSEKAERKTDGANASEPAHK